MNLDRNLPVTKLPVFLRGPFTENSQFVHTLTCTSINWKNCFWNKYHYLIVTLRLLVICLLFQWQLEPLSITISLNVSAFFSIFLNFRDFFTAKKSSFGVPHCRGTYVPLEEQSLRKWTELMQILHFFKKFLLNLHCFFKFYLFTGITYIFNFFAISMSLMLHISHLSFVINSHLWWCIFKHTKRK